VGVLAQAGFRRANRPDPAHRARGRIGAQLGGLIYFR